MGFGMVRLQPMTPMGYVLSIIQKEVVPFRVAFGIYPSKFYPLVIGRELEAAYSNFTRKRIIVHKPRWDRKPKCSFEEIPLDFLRDPVCPVCGYRGHGLLCSGEGDEVLINDFARRAYRELVNGYTDWALRYYHYPGNRNWREEQQRGKGKIHTDHIYPLSEAFRLGVPDYVVGSPVNIQRIPANVNLTKGARVDQSLDTLLARYEKFALSFPEWEELATYVQREGKFGGGPRPTKEWQAEEL